MNRSRDSWRMDARAWAVAGLHAFRAPRLKTVARVARRRVHLFRYAHLYIASHVSPPMCLPLLLLGISSGMVSTMMPYGQYFSSQHGLQRRSFLYLRGFDSSRTIPSLRAREISQSQQYSPAC